MHQVQYTLDQSVGLYHVWSIQWLFKRSFSFWYTTIRLSNYDLYETFEAYLDVYHLIHFS